MEIGNWKCILGNLLLSFPIADSHFFCASAVRINLYTAPAAAEASY